MIIPNKKLESGFEMPAFGIGTWYIGGGVTPETTNDEKDMNGFKAAIDAGVSLIDCAEFYAAGHAYGNHEGA